MTVIVNLLAIEPPARFDGVPWTIAHVLEAVSPELAGVVIDTQALAVVDADPTAPAPRNVTTTAATLDIGWYRLMFEDAAGVVSGPSEPVRNSVLASQLPPSPEQIRDRSPLLRSRYPEPATDAEQQRDLRAAVYSSTGEAMAQTWRIIDPTLGCPAPVDYVCELTPDSLVEVALQLITKLSERLTVTSEATFAAQLATGRLLRGFTAGPYSESYFTPGEFARRGVQGRPAMDPDEAINELLWALATEDARDYFVWRSTGNAPPVGVATAFDYRRESLGYAAGQLSRWGDAGAHGGPDGF